MLQIFKGPCVYVWFISLLFIRYLKRNGMHHICSALTEAANFVFVLQTSGLKVGFEVYLGMGRLCLLYEILKEE